MKYNAQLSNKALFIILAEAARHSMRINELGRISESSLAACVPPAGEHQSSS